MICAKQEDTSNGFASAQRDEFTSVEVEAAMRVLAAGLRPGASRDEFVSRGLKGDGLTRAGR